MWDPNIGLGTVTHQNIGYLFPMGPYYWLTHTLGVPAWVVAAALVRHDPALRRARACCTCSARCTSAGPGVVVADARVHAVAVRRSTFAARLSVILLPWAALPWLLGVGRSARCATTGWKYPALFAIVVQVVGSVNATALVFAGIVPALWVLVRVAGDARGRRGGASSRPWRRSRVLTLLASLWWIVGLWRPERRTGSTS